MLKKNKIRKLFSIFSVCLVIFSSLVMLPAKFSYATDSAEETAREAEEQRLEEERNAQQQAEKQAREAAEQVREAVEDLSPTPTPQPTIPVSSPETVDGQTGLSAENSGTQEATNTDNSSSSDSDVSVENTNTSNVDNNVVVESNSGNNVIAQDASPTPTPTLPSQAPDDPLPKCEDNLVKSEDVAGEEDALLYESAEVNPSDSSQETLDSQSQVNADSETTDNDTLDVDNSNCASLSNDQQVSAESGNNSLSGNDGSYLNTGDASADSNNQNTGNKNITENQTDISADSTGSETNTDNDSLKVDNNNQIYAENEIEVESSSGGNTLNDNDGTAQLTTGDIDLMVTLLNILNLNITGEEFTHLIVNIFGDLTGDVDLDKIAQNIGMTDEQIVAISRNELSEQETNNYLINNNNQAVVDNDVNVSGVSGDNDLSNNEDKTSVMTGRIKILVALINFINTNYVGTDWYFAMVNIFGSLQGDLVLPDPNQFLIDETSASNNSTNNNGTTDTEIKNENNISSQNDNQVDINNNIAVSGDTGSNTAFDNDDQVNQNTGEVNVIGQLSNWLNVNIFGNNWVFLVINVFGKWYGQILGFPQIGNIDAPENGMLMLAAGGVNNAGPQVDQGSQSQNSEVNIEETNNWEVKNNNQAVVDNNLQVSGVSGGNSTNNNEDPVFVNTGWIDISANLLNIVNMNITGKNWMLVIVNIFGDFIGDITFPGVKKAAVAEFLEDSTSGDFAFAQTAQDNANNGSDNTSQNDPDSKITTLTGNPVNAIDEIQNNYDSKIQQVDTNSNKIEIYQAQSESGNQQNDQVSGDDQIEVLGITMTAGKDTKHLLLIIALLSYLIAFRFWAFKKSSYN